ncbi:T9SS type B sorting domain-containing protein [Flavitalea antarctica]
MVAVFTSSMKHLWLWLLTTVVIFLINLPCAVASDSLIIASLRATNGSVEGVCLTTTIDASSLIGGVYKMSGNAQEKGFVVKLDPAGNIVWNTSLGSLLKSSRVNKILELASGDVLIMGRTIENSSPERSVPFVTRLNANGQLIWTKSLAEDLVITNNLKIAITAVSEGLGGDILIAATATGTLNGSNADHGIFVRLDINGNVVVNKLFVSYDGTFNNFIGVFLHKGKIFLFGFIIDNECPQLDTRAIYGLQLDYGSGNIVDTKRFCFGNTPTTLSYSVLRHNYRVEKIQNKFVLWGFLAEATSTNRNQLLVVFDESLAIEQSKSVYSSFLLAPRSQMKPDSAFNFHMISTRPGGYQYYSYFNLNGKVLTQMSRVSVPGIDYYLSEGGENVEVSGKRIRYFSNTSSTPFPSFEVVHQDLGFEAFESCSARDTSFPITVDPFTLYSSDLEFKSIEDNVVSVQPIVLTQTTLSLTISPLCADENVCNSIKISGPDTVCVVEGQVYYSASRNTKCNQALMWDVKATDIYTLTNINDSTIAVTFRGLGATTTKVKIYAYVGVDKAILDSLVITLVPPGNFLNPQFFLCPGDTIKLTPGNWFKMYQWQDGSSDSVFNVTKAGTYTVRFFSFCNAVQTKSITITEPPSLLNTARTVNLCNNDKLEIVPANGYSNYFWRAQEGLEVLADGKTARLSSITQDKTFRIEALAFPGCTISDSIQIKVKSPIKPDLGKDTALCQGKRLVLKPQPGFKSYLWNDGTTSSETVVSSPGTYRLNATDMNDCKSADTVIVSQIRCTQKINFPNAFTPDGNGLNDKFRPIISGELIYYDLKIYNRYGQVVFATRDIGTTWDGRLSQKMQPQGVFVWVCSYQFINEAMSVQHGTLTLSR